MGPVSKKTKEKRPAKSGLAIDTKATDLIARPPTEDLPVLAAELVHEAKNPLASIHLHLQLLEAYLGEVKDAALQQKLKDKVRFIQKEISQLDKTLHNFLQSIRQERRALQGKVDLNQILSGARELLLPQAREAGIRLELQAAEPEPLVEADEGFIKQIAINLILNAMQAFAEMAVEVVPEDRAIVIKTGEREGHAFFVIADNGPGIPEEVQQKIFEPWYTTKASKGSGIGLALVKKMVAEMGAHLELQSRAGHGSSFSVIFPKASA